MDAIQHVGYKVVLHVRATEVIGNCSSGGGDQHQYIAFVMEQRLELFLHRDIVRVAGHLLHVFHHTLTGVEIFNQQQRNGQHRHTANQIPERIESLVRLDHIGQQNAVDDHADQRTGYQCPADFTGKGYFLPVNDVPAAQRDDVIVENVIKRSNTIK